MPKQVNCWVCNHPAYKQEVPVRGGEKFDINICNHCELHFFTHDNTSMLREDQLDQTRLKAADLEIPEVAKDFKNGLQQSAEYIESYIEESDRSTNILEIGCSWGYFLDLLKKLGANPYGVELNSVRSEYVNCKLGIPCFQAVEDIEQQGITFNKIFMFYVLEYIPNPVDYFNRLWKLLDSNGVIYVITPNLHDILKDVWRNTGYIDFFFEKCAVAYYSVRTVKTLFSIIQNDSKKLRIHTEQGYSFLNHVNWFFTNKPMTSGVVGGDKFIEKVCRTINSSENRLGRQLSELIREFDRNYRKLIENADYGNNIVIEILK